MAEAATQLNDHSAIPFIRGMIAARQNRLSEAISLFSKVLTNEPDHVRARLNRCSASLLKGDWSSALEDANHLSFSSFRQCWDLDRSWQMSGAHNNTIGQTAQPKLSRNRRDLTSS